MEQYISKSAIVAEINKRIIDAPVNNIGHQRVWAYNDVKDIIDTLEVKEVDLELITGWFDHVAQMADDRKTLNGEVMEDWAALDEIKCLAKNSSEFITKHYKAQKGEKV